MNRPFLSTTDLIYILQSSVFETRTLSGLASAWATARVLGRWRWHSDTTKLQFESQPEKEVEMKVSL